MHQPLAGRTAIAAASLAAVLAAQSPDPAWSFLGMGQHAGPHVQTVHIGNAVAILVPGASTSAFRGSRYWTEWRRNASGTDYEQVYASPIRPTDDVIVWLATWSSSPTTPRLVVMTRRGNVEVWDLATHTRSSAFTIAAAGATTGLLADIDSDGSPDVVMAGSSGLVAAHLDGTQFLSVPGVGGNYLAVGQMDGDPSIEIASTSGDVVDVASQTVQFHWQNGFGVDVLASDIDGDGMDELVVAENQSWLWAWDIDLRLPKWSHYVLDLDCLAKANVDADPQIEILVGGGQSTGILAIDPLTLHEDLHIPYYGNGTSTMAIDDVDLDGQLEITWMSSFPSAQALIVSDLTSGATEWTNPHIPERGHGPFLGDVDGDGAEELVYVTDRGSTAARVVIVDPVLHRLKAAPILSPFRDPVDLDLVDVNGDGDMEIAVTDSQFTVFDLSGGQLVPLWQLASPVIMGPGQAVFADLDGNGVLELALSVNGLVQVFDYGNSTERWRVPSVGVASSLVAAQMDTDPALELVLLRTDGAIEIIDGIAHQQQALIQSQGSLWTALDILTPGGGLPLPSPGIVTADASGGVAVLIDNGGGYTSIGPFPVATSRIDGIQWIAGTTMFAFGAAGRVTINDMLTPLWTSSDLGLFAGRTMAIDLGHLTLATVGTYGLSVFQF